MKTILKIRQASENDLRSILLFEFRNRNWFAKFIPQETLRQQSQIYFKRLLRSDIKKFQYLVFLPNDVLIGRFSGQLLDENSLEVSYRISKNFTNRGIAKYVLKNLLLVWASNGINEVYAQVADHNKASIRVLASCAFELQEVQENSINLAGEIHDSHVFRWSTTEDIVPLYTTPDSSIIYLER
ncbi:MAG: GNAT family N-acetyltransferase [Marinomonas foliarum]|jgi:[ribosomal protein S5]-alanine N-acetyltransferase|uniref:GNAT family N-acetyltransferase n=1 Tax=Marinomonas foliarum TaxID=491950 RepID=A0A368ZDA2_9GAMM|nr:GNAT family N-acetyltransferase [Marinomonas foliarum]QRV24072.1 GNAT family N-acetyltransferase [Marinomonas foliarum]RCW91178.1 ribosomal-protein-alanine N-acetyltransferase [Marinomonas foliarum]